MRTPETPTASSTPEHPVTDAVPDSAATPRDFPIQQGRPGQRDEVAVKHDSATFGLEELVVTW